jgi:hypothetical protein
MPSTRGRGSSDALLKDLFGRLMPCWYVNRVEGIELATPLSGLTEALRCRRSVSVCHGLRRAKRDAQLIFRRKRLTQSVLKNMT